MKKIVVNRCFGGFSLSIEAASKLKDLGYTGHAWDIDRDDERLIRVVEELGVAANGNHADLEIVEIPDDVKWIIDEYDGKEAVAEAHRTW